MKAQTIAGIVMMVAGALAMVAFGSMWLRGAHTQLTDTIGIPTGSLAVAGVVALAAGIGLTTAWGNRR